MNRKLAIDGGERLISTPLKSRFNVGEEEKQAVIGLFDKTISTGQCFGYNGEEERLFCEEFVEFMGGGCADAVNSGSSAVYVALRALDPPPYSEVVVGAITDPGGMMPIVMMNCIPVPADVIPNGYNTGPKEIEERISPRTSAIVVAHLQGEPADMNGILAVARKYDLPVVEDCAQAYCCKLNGKLVGTFGDTAGFSTMFGKHMNTGGQGGIVYSRDPERYWDLRRYSDRGKPFGLPEGSTNIYASHNFNLDELACTIGRVQLRKVQSIVDRRIEIAENIVRGLAERQIDCLIPPEFLPGAEPSYWYLRLRVDASKLLCSKMDFLKAVQAEGVLMIADYHAGLPSAFTWYTEKRVFGNRGLPWSSSEYKGDPDEVYEIPNAIKSVDEHFNLHVYESWGEEEVDLILRSFEKVYHAYRA